MPSRQGMNFGRKATDHLDSMRSFDDCIEGYFRDTIPGALIFAGGPAALMHVDIGSRDKHATVVLASWLLAAAKALPKKLSLSVFGQPLSIIRTKLLLLLQRVLEGKYQMQQMI